MRTRSSLGVSIRMDTTPNLALPYIMASQAQKHVTHNEAIRALDAIVQIAVADRDLSAPPSSPGDGDRYIVAADPTGDWSGQAGAIAAWQDGAWQFYAPNEGWLAWVADESALLAFDGGTWVTAASASALQDVPMLGVNASADTTNRLALAAAASLFNHAGAGHQQKINKASASDTASQLYQTDFSGRAEFGLTGDDDFHVKVSPDGSTWFDAIIVDRNTGFVGLGATPPSGASRLTIKGDNNLKSQLKAWQVLDTAAGGGGILLFHNRSSGAPLAGDRLGYFFFGSDNAGANVNGGGISAAADGAWTFGASHPTRFVFETTPAGSTARVERMRIDAAGNVGIGVTPACKLDVDGPVRVKSYTVAGLPPANAGAGQIIYVSNETGGAVLAFSDGTNWRRVTDRNIIT